MKKAWLLAVCLAAGILSTQAQPYVKQVITFSLTGNEGPEAQTQKGNTLTYKPKVFKTTDKGLCAFIAADNGISVKSPQLIKLFDLAGDFIGYYVMDGNKVVADAGPYFARIAHDTSVFSGSDVFNVRSFLHTVVDSEYASDSWSIGYLNVTGTSTSSVKSTYPDGAPDSSSFSSINFSATISGSFSNPDNGAYGVCAGTIRAVSTVVKTAIPGL